MEQQQSDASQTAMPLSGPMKRILIAFSLYTVFSVLETLLHRHFFFQQMPIETQDFVIKTIKFAPGPLLIFVLKFHICLFVLAVATELLRKSSGMRTISGPVAYVVLVAVFFNLSEIPQVFSKTIDERWMVFASWLLVPTLISLPLMSLYQLYRKRTWANALGLGILLLFISVFTAYNARSPGLFDHRNGPVEHIPTNSVLILSLDSLRPDFVADYIQKNPSSELARLAEGAVQFDRIITTTAKTHASLTALLTGEQPEQHGMRDNLFPGFMESDHLYANKGLVPTLRNRNFLTRLILDETKFAQFTEGQAFDRVVAPEYGYMNLLVSEVFKSNLYWSYFANSFGHLIFPEAELNFAFSYGYKPKDFLHEIYRQIDSTSNRPVFLLAHTCALHYPGDSRAPYLQRYQTEPENLVTRYPNFFAQGKTTADAELKQYRHLTRGKLDMVMDEVVEPFLKDLRESGALSRIHLVLMSDHGETFWRPGLRYSRLQLPYHGQPAILDEDSQEMFAMIHSPQLKAERVRSVQSITDLTRYLIEVVDTEKPLPAISSRPSQEFRYTESGTLGFGIFNSALNLGSRILIDGHDFTPKGGMLIRPNQVDRLTVQKTRTIYGQSHHWSFFPTYYGYETLVCSPPTCWTPTKRDALELRKVSTFYNKETTIDQQSGIAIPLSTRLNRTGDAQWIYQKGSKLKPVARWLQGTHQLNADGNVAGAYQAWMSILVPDPAESPPSEEDQFMAFRSLLGVCAYPNVALRAGQTQRCSAFNDWLLQQRNDPSKISKWVAMSRDWTYFLRGQWYIGDILQKLGLTPRASSSAEFEDDFSRTFRSAISSSQSSEFRKFIQDRRIDPLFDSNFFRRFWAKANPEPPRDLAAARGEIEKIRAQIESELQLRFYEVDWNWISFLQRYSEIEKLDVFTEEATQFMKDARLPFVQTVRTFVPRILNISDKQCYHDRILPLVLEENSSFATANTSWQINFLEKTRLLMPICQP